MDERQDQVRRIKDLLDIVDVVGSYVDLTKRGTRHIALCPFHAEKDASFTVNQQDQFFHCFGCKKSGDIFDFVMAMEGVSFPEALRTLGDRCGVRIERDKGWQKGSRKNYKTRLYKVLEAASRFFEKNLQAGGGAGVRQYLSSRGFPPDALHQFRLGFALEAWRGLLEALTRQGFPIGELMRAGLVKQGQSGSPYDLFRNRLMIPIFDMQGRVVGFGGRVLDDSEPKYINSPETEVFRKNRLLYGLYRARRTISLNRTAVVVEGYTDVLMAHQRGVSNTVATLGTALTQEHAAILRRMADRVLLFFDGDSAGALAAERGVEILLGNDLEVTVIPLDKGVDPCDFLRHSDEDQFLKFVGAQGQDFFDFTLQGLKDRHDMATPGGRARIAREMFRLVAALEDPIKRDLVLRRIAETLDIREDLLRREFHKTDSRDSGRSSGDESLREKGEAAPKLPRSLALAEEDLLLGLLMNFDLIDEFREDLEKVRFQGESENKILELLLEKSRSGPPEPKEMLSQLRIDERARIRLITLLSEARQTEPKALVAQALDYFSSSEKEREYQRLKKKHKQSAGAEEEGSDRSLAELDRLLKEKNGQQQREIL